MSIRQHDFTIERRFRQSPEQTFQAFADPDLRQRWFRLPDSWTDTEWSLEFGLGGGEINGGRDRGGTHHLFLRRRHGRDRRSATPVRRSRLHRHLAYELRGARPAAVNASQSVTSRREPPAHFDQPGLTSPDS
jgi:hypothetical protein